MKGSRFEFDSYRPGCVSAVISLHMQYYAKEWDFGRQFEAKLARELGEFIDRFDPTRDLFLTAYDRSGDLAGSITIDGIAHPKGHLRWFIVASANAGKGLGAELLKRSNEHAQDCSYKTIYLTTFEGLDPAQKLYEHQGYELTHSKESDPWSGSVGLQQYEKTLI